MSLTKARAEKAWLLYEFPASLNSSDILNDVQTWNSNSSFYPGTTEDQFQAKKKKNWWKINLEIN